MPVRSRRIEHFVDNAHNGLFNSDNHNEQEFKWNDGCYDRNLCLMLVALAVIIVFNVGGYIYLYYK